MGTGTVQFVGTVGAGGGNNDVGAIAITGGLNLDAAITSAASLSVTKASNLGASVTTSGVQRMVLITLIQLLFLLMLL